MNDTARSEWNPADADYMRVYEGLCRVYEADQSTAVMDEFAANLSLLEQRNEATFASLRQRCGTAMTRCQTLALALAALIVWAAEKEILKHAGAPFAGALTSIATFAISSTLAAIAVSVWADRVAALTRIAWEALNPFLMAESTAQHRDAYRLWLLPARLDAAREAHRMLKTMARRVRIMQGVVACATAGTLAFAMTAALGGL